MIKKTSLNLLQAVQNHRLGLWILLILLTAIILLFPVHLHFEYHVIESIYAFGNKLPLFGILYCIWLGILLLLLFAKGKHNEWQRLALVCIFALVFFGLWIINTPYGGHWDEVWNMAHVKYLQETGRISLVHPNLGYFQFPSIHLIALSLSQICGLGIFATRTLFLLFSGVLFAALSYLLFMQFLKNSYFASLAALLMCQGNLVALHLQAFWPGNPAFLFLMALLVLLAKREDRALGTATPVALITVILLAAFTMSYLPLPAYFIFILAGVYLLQKVAKKNVVRSSTIVLFLTMFLAWEMYWSVSQFSDLVGLAPAFVAGFMNPGERFFSASAVATVSLGESVPLWARAIKFFWLALVLVVGGILGIWNLVKARKLDSTQVIETGGLLGATVLSTSFLFVFPAGVSHFARLLVCAPLFTIPIMLGFLSGFSRHNELPHGNTLREDADGSFHCNGFHKSLGNFWGWFRRHVLSLLIILFFVLSLPTFLVASSAVSTTSVYPYELSGGEFLESAYGAEELSLFSNVIISSMYSYYVPEAHFVSMLTPEEQPSEEVLWLKMNEWVYNFENSRDGDAIFVLSERFRQSSHFPVTIEPTDPRWVAWYDRLGKNNRIYNNGHIEIYERLAE